MQGMHRGLQAKYLVQASRVLSSRSHTYDGISQLKGNASNPKLKASEIQTININVSEMIVMFLKGRLWRCRYLCVLVQFGEVNSNKSMVY